MFKQVYKQALDKQNPKEGLIEEILLKSKSETFYKSKPKYNFTKITSYAASVAAAFVVALAFVVYPQLSDLHKARRAQDSEYQIQNMEIKNRTYITSDEDASERLLSPSKDKDNKTAAGENSDSEKVLNSANENNTPPADKQETVSQQSDAEQKNIPDAFRMSESENNVVSHQSETAFEENAQENMVENNAPTSGSGEGLDSRMISVPQTSSEDAYNISATGDVIFDNASAISEALGYITTDYINADAYEQDGIWYVSFYTESEAITVSLNAHDGDLVELTRKNI